MEPNTKNLDDLAHSDWNPRTISKADFEALKKSMMEFGDLSGVVKNLETGTLVGGNQRLDAFRQLQAPRIILSEIYTEPSVVGTVAHGYIQLPNNERFAYREVRWPLAKEKAANIAANRIQGEFDIDLLAKVTAELKELSPELLDLTGQTTDEIDRMIAMLGSEEKFNATREWQGMPEFVSEDMGPVKQLIINFTSLEDIPKFAELLGQNITEKTKSIWYPPVEIQSMIEKQYE